VECDPLDGAERFEGHAQDALDSLSALIDSVFGQLSPVPR